ncbi:PKD domain-containing protein [Rubripirellula reticaptiva]|uniref:Bifunctional hemolysin/adenylate cyclase n=1 Tax=Rubripirellula reticaptiva TaxID=2528013 RepID=A0A5C6EUX5_9BACT|nr:PKD domain-containing protein [Rubripirellula reticaptiva]TWU51857.1 Bifunctional hemolysin/adenylate cyclase precursor [Rubripirellula reticaptiva]
MNRSKSAHSAVNERKRDSLKRRRMLAETLEQRQLLAGDFDTEVFGPQPLYAQVSAEGEGSLDGVAETIDGAAAVGSDAINSFASGLREAVDQISRVVSAIDSAPALAAEIPYLGSLVPESVAGTTLIDTESIASLYRLADRFETDVAVPLANFLDSNPTATAFQLISQFDFLDSAPGLESGQQGVRLNFNLSEQFDSSLATLLEPITSRADSLLDAVDGDALATDLPFDLSLEDFSFDVIRDAAENVSVAIPDIVLRLASADAVPINFSAQVGFLAGGVTGGSLSADVGLQINTSNLLGGTLSLDSLRSLDLSEALNSLRVEVVGRGLDLRLPFEFELSGFNTGGFNPVFVLTDANPFDSILPQVDLQIPRGAPYDSGAITGFASIDATAILTTLDEIGATFGVWESGDALNYPMPLGDDVSLGDVAGFADAYGGAVLQFLKTDDGLPAFNSIQELVSLIPSVAENAAEFVNYDPASKLLTIDIGVAWQPDPIIRRANLSVIAGAADSPIASIQMTPGDDGTNNVLTINGNASFDFELEIDLSGRESNRQVDVDTIGVDPRGPNAVSANGRNDIVIDQTTVALSTPMRTIADRFGLTYLRDEQQTLRVKLENGQEYSVDMGVIDDHVTLAEWLERGTVLADDGTPLMTLEFRPTVVVGSEFDSSRDRFHVIDHTARQDRVQIYPAFVNATNVGFLDDSAYRDSEQWFLRTVGEARRYAFYEAVDHLETLLSKAGGAGEYRIGATYQSIPDEVRPDGSVNTTLAFAGPSHSEAGNASFGGDPSLEYPVSLIDHLSGGPTQPQLADGKSAVVINATFNLDVPWDYKTSGPSDLEKFPFFKIAVHELLHGFGFLSNFKENGSLPANTRPAVFDSFIALADRDDITETGVTFTPIIGLPNDAARATAFKSNRLYFTGLNTSASNPNDPGMPVKLYAPALFQGGSSVSHFDQESYEPDETMVPFFSDNDFSPAQITALSRAVLEDLGYQTAQTPKTQVLSTDPFWETIFSSQTAGSGVPSSQPLDSAVGLVDTTTPLSHFFPRDMPGMDLPSQPLQLTLLDGSVVDIELGPINSLTIQDLQNALSDQDNFEYVLQPVEDRLTVIDNTTAVAGGVLQIRRAAGTSGSRLIERFLPVISANPSSDTLPLGDAVTPLPENETYFRLHSTTLSDVLTREEGALIYGREHTAQMTLVDGLEIPITTGVLTAESTLLQIANSLRQSFPNLQPRVDVGIAPGDDRIYIHDRYLVVRDDLFREIDPANGTIDQVAFGLSDSTPGGNGIFDLLFASQHLDDRGINPDQDEYIFSDSLTTRVGSKLSTNPELSVFVDVETEVDPRTPLDILIDRRLGKTMGLIDQTFRILRADGSEAVFTLPGDARGYTLESAIEQLVARDNAGNELARVVLNNNRAAIQTTLAEQNWQFAAGGDLATVLFGSKRFEVDGLISGTPLSDTVLHRHAEDTRIELFLEQGFARFNGSDDYKYQTSGNALVGDRKIADLTMRLFDGTQIDVEVPTFGGLTLGQFVQFLNVSRDGTPLIRAVFKDDAIEITDLTRQDGVSSSLSDAFAIEYADGSTGSLWLRSFIPFDVDLDSDGVLRGPRLFPELPQNLDAAVNSNTLLSDVTGRLFLPDLQGTRPSLIARLSDGVARTLVLDLVDQDTTLFDIVRGLRLSENGGEVIDANVVGDRLVISNVESVPGTFSLEVDPSGDSRLFVAMGLVNDSFGPVPAPVIGDIERRSLPLSVSPLSVRTLLSEVFGDNHALLGGDTITLGYDNSGAFEPLTIEPFSVGPFGPTSTFDDLLKSLTNGFGDRAVRNRLSASLSRGRIVVAHAGGPTSNQSTTLSIVEANSPMGQAFAELFPSLSDLDDDGQFLSRLLTIPLPAESIQPQTPLRHLYEGGEFDRRIGANSVVPIQIQLRDGTTETIDIAHDSSMTVAQYIDQYEVRRNGAVVLSASLQPVASASGPSTYRAMLVDQTVPVSGGELSVTIDRSQGEVLNAIPLELGLIGIDQTGAGRIVSGDLTTPAQREPRIRISRAPQLHAEFSAVASNLVATAGIGDLVSATVDNGSASLSGSISLGVPMPAGQDYLTLADLTRSLIDPFNSLDLDVDLDLFVDADVTLDLAGLNEQPLPAEQPRIELQWDNIIAVDPQFRLQPENFSLTTENFDNLIQFGRLSVEDITNLIRKLADFITNLTGEDLLDRQLPLVNTSLGEILNAVDYVAELVDRISNDPNGSLNTLETEIESMLGLAPEELDLSYDLVEHIFRVDLNLGFDETTSASFDLDLSDLGLSQLDGLVDFNTSGSVGVQAGGELRAHLGLDLDELDHANFDDAVVVFDTSGFYATARAYADDIAFTTSVLSLGVDVGPGRIALDADGLNFDGTAENTDRAELSIAPVGTWSGGRKPLLELSASDFEFNFDEDSISLGVDLPVTFLGSTEPFQIQWNDLTSFQFDVLDPGVTIDASGSTANNVIAVPDIQAATSNISLGDGLIALAEGLQGLFGVIDDYLGDEVLGIPVPLIGEGLADAVSFVESFVAPLADELRGATFDDAVSIVGQRILYDVLGPGDTLPGLNVLRDLNNDGEITLADVGVVVDGLDEIAYEISIGRAGLELRTPINLDVGGSALGLDLEGQAAITAGYGLNLIVGFTRSEGPYVEFGDQTEFSIDYFAGIEDLVGEGRLGPLFVTVETIAPENLSDDLRRRARLDENLVSTEAINAIRGSFGVDLPAGRYTLSTIGGALSQINLSADFVGSLHAQINTGINTTIEGIPSLVADLHLTFDDPAETTLAGVIDSIALPTVSITNVGLDLGSFVTNVLAPVLAPVNDFLDPIRPVLDRLTSPIPGISELIGPTTFVDLIGAFGEGGETVGQFVGAVANIVELIDIPTNAQTIILPLGNFDTAIDDVTGELVPVPMGGQSNFDDFLDTVGEDAAEIRDYLRNIPQEEPQYNSSGELTVTPGMFSIPLLKDPTSAIGLLFGNDVDLLKYQAPRLQASFEFSQSIPVFPAFSLAFGGQFSTTIDFAFGYDTAGIFAYADSGRAIDLLDGFFFDDRAVFENGNKISDVPELTFRFAVTAGGQLDLLVAKAGVDIGIGAQLNLDLNDPNLDGKIRFDEVISNLQLGNAPGLGPLWIFDPSGQLDFFVTAYVKAFGIRVSTTLGPKVLVNYDFPRPEPANPVLGHVEPGGQLVIHAGPNAALRVEGDLSDGDDIIFVSGDEDTGETIITGYGTDQRFSGVTSVFVDLGEGDDGLFVDENYARPITAFGRLGRDEITGGTGRLTAYGGGGDDVIFGGSGDDRLYGNGDANGLGASALGTITRTLPDGRVLSFNVTDADLIDGGDGNDQIFGGEEDDQLQGGGGNDRIHGGTGADYVGGGDGDDVLFGGDGDDTLSGDDGNDTVYGEAEDGTGVGRDFLQGGDGDDVLRGGPADDELFGGYGSDQLYGGDGNDLLVGAIAPRDSENYAILQGTPDASPHYFDGGAGNDLIYGTEGIDTVTDSAGLTRVFTYGGNDVISTGDGDDLIRSGDGDDVINAGSGNNRIYAGEGFDIVDSGFGDDLIDLRGAGLGLTQTGVNSGGQVTDMGGNNRILGDGGDDIIDVLGSGSNYIDAGGGNNRIVTVGRGGDRIRTGSGVDVIDAGDGNNNISSGAGDDIVRSGSGNDSVFLGDGNDEAFTGAGNDVVIAGAGNDFVDAGAGSDVIRGGDGDDELVGGIGSDTIRGDEGDDVVWGGRLIYERDVLLATLVRPTEYDANASSIVFPAMVPAVVIDGPLEGSLEDGNDLIFGGGGINFIFGGGGNDDISGGSGSAYIDGGRGNDILRGTPGNDVIRGGAGNDTIEGLQNIDFSYGDSGDDFIIGGSGVNIDGTHQTFGQRSFGGSGNDVLWAYAHTTGAGEVSLRGEYLDGGEGADELLGNLRQDVLIGGGGDDRLLGDALAGPDYDSNDDFRTFGGDDLIVGGFGDDLLQGGGGNDVLFGGGNVDELEGHDGDDRLYGGRGIDFLRLDVAAEYGDDLDVLDGGFADGPDETPFGLDNATDIMIVNGSDQNDVITIAGNGNQAIVNYQVGNQPLRQIDIRVQDAMGNTLVEQYQINGLAGNDTIGFDASFDTSDLAARSRDWVGVFQGGSGDDTLIGSAGRDRLDGGRGSDTVFGLGGDDRLWGDSGEGRSSDIDRLFAGTGNDDLLGGVGRNYLYAWSSDPATTSPYGIFDDDGEAEDTGLNRMLGRDQDDFLYAGTGLDFMYGGDGRDQLHDVDGNLLENFGVPEDEEWLEYARNNDSVWYYGATERDDIISVDFVTEPGLLGNHHLITRLTENNGFFSFDAQVRLDFSATNPDGSLVWDPSDLVQRVEEIRGAVGDDARQLVARSLELSGDLLPAEGDFTAIIINAGAGDDQVFVGPTVQKTVWTGAGAGDDTVEYAGGTAILVDIADADPRNEVFGDADDFSRAYEISDSENGQPSRLRETIYFEKLTLDSPTDVDWFTFVSSGMTPSEQLRVVVDSLSDDDAIEVELYEYVDDDGINELASVGTLETEAAALDPTRPSRTSLVRGNALYPDGQRLYLRVRSTNGSPTSYNLGIDFGGDVALGSARVELGSQSNTFLRRDVIVGGAGDDILRGGPGEDWVIGGDGDDIITGGVDGFASDILIGGDGNDVFQIIPSDVGELDLTLADEIEGGDGYDRVLYLGGDIDDRGRPVPDFVTLRYQPLLNAWQLAAKVWDTANQRFETNGNEFVIHSASYRARQIEATEFDTRAGADQVRLDEASYSILDDEIVNVSGFQFDLVDGTNDQRQTYGVSPGDRQVGGGAANFIIRGGSGNDLLVGSPYGDVIFGGDGLDQIIGGGGNDSLDGEGGNDLIVGDSIASPASVWDRFEVIAGQDRSNDSPAFATPVQFVGDSLENLTLHDGDGGDWFVLPASAAADPLASNDLVVDFDDSEMESLWSSINQASGRNGAEVIPALVDPQTGNYTPTSGQPDVYLIGVNNPVGQVIVATSAPRLDLIGDGQTVGAAFVLDISGQPTVTVRFDVSSGQSGESIADNINRELNDQLLQFDVQAFYDATRARLILVSLRGRAMTVRSENIFSFSYLGFEDGQVPRQLPYGLGGYRVSVVDNEIVNQAPLGPSLPSLVFEYETADRSVLSATPSQAIGLNDAGFAVATAARIEGGRRDEMISEVVPLGDINADGRPDFVVPGETKAYVFLGHVDPNFLFGDQSDIRDAADYVLNYPNAGTIEWISGPVDVDGDGFDDLTYARTSFSDAARTDGVTSVNMISGSNLTQNSAQLFAIPMGGFEYQDLDHQFDLFGKQLASLNRSVDVPIQAEWIRYNNDEFADLAIFGKEPSLRRGVANVNYGGVLDGQQIHDQVVNNSTGNSNYLTTIVRGLEDSGVVAATHFDDPASVMYVGGSPEAFFDFGDINGDGLDDIVATVPRGWEFSTNGSVEPDVVISRTYLRTGGSFGFGGRLASPILQLAAETAGLRDPNNPDLGNQGALNAELPIVVKDLDNDGFADLIAISDLGNPGPGSGSLLIYTGQELTSDDDFANREVAVTFARIPASGRSLLDARVSIGDFDGNGKQDLGFSFSNPILAGTNIFYDAIDGGSVRSINVGLQRPTPVTSISSPVGASNFGLAGGNAIDLNGDRIDDLILADPEATTSAGDLRGGILYVVPGSQRRVFLPDESLVVDLGNDSIRGIGDVSRDSQGQLQVKSTIQASTETDWYRFRTVGDGQIGDVIRLLPTTDQFVPATRGASGIISGGNAFDNVPSVVFDSNQTGVYEIDLSRLLTVFDDPASIGSAELRLRGSATRTPVDSAPALSLLEELTPVSGGGFGERVFFVAVAEDKGSELYVTDGSASGTRLVYETIAGPESANPANLTAIDDRLVFSTSVFELLEESSTVSFFVTDGTDTKPVGNPDNLNLQPGSELMEFGGDLYFSAFDQSNFTRVLAVIRFEDDGSSELAIVEQSRRTPIATTTNAIFFANNGELSRMEIDQEEPTVVSDQFEFIPGADSLTAQEGLLIFAASDKSSGNLGVYVTDGSSIDPLDEFSDDFDDLAYGFQTTVDGVFYLVQDRVFFYDGSSVERIATIDVPDATRSNGMFRTFTDGSVLVTIGNNGNKELRINAFNDKGNKISESSLGTGRYIFSTDAILDGDELLVGYQSQEEAFGEVTLGLSTFHIVDSTVKLLEEFVDTPQSSGTFDQMTSSGGNVVMEGYRTDNVLGGRLWAADVPDRTAAPIESDNSTGMPTSGSVTFQIAGGRNDLVITGDELDENFVIQGTITLDETPTLQTIDLSADIDQIRHLFELGYRSLVVQLNVADGDAVFEEMVLSDDTGLFLGGNGRGVSGQLLDSEGRMIASDFNHLDIRNLVAGEYLIGVSRVADGTSTTQEYSLELDVPRLGDAHDTSSDDVLRGGDGDDVLIGGAGKDRIFGDSGDDSLIGELFELRGAASNDAIGSPLPEERFSDSRSPRQHRDPRIVIGAASAGLQSGQVSIGNSVLALAIADALGTTIERSSDGSEHFARPVFASDLGSISSLDLFGLGLTSIDGVQHLVNLRWLDLSRNDLSSAAISLLRPGNDGTTGLQHIQHLNLDGNRLTGLGNLNSLTTLRSLSLADQRNRGITGVVAIRFLTELRYLNVSGNQVTDLSPLADLTNLRILDASGEEYAQAGLNNIDISSFLGIRFEDASIKGTSGDWFSGSNPDAVAGSYLALDATLSDAGDSLTWAVDNIDVKRPFDVYALWHGDASHVSQAIYQINGEVIGFADQRVASSGLPLGSRQLQLVGSYEGDEEDLNITVLAGSADGILIADVLVLVPQIASPAEPLIHVDVRGTSIDPIQRDLLLGGVLNRGGVLHADDNAAPTFVGPFGFALKSDERRSFALSTLFSDDQNGLLAYSVQTIGDSIRATVNGSSIDIEAGSQSGHATMQITATDAAGASTTIVLPVSVGYALVQGRVTDTSDKPVEGFRVTADAGVVFQTPTDSDGRYLLIIEVDQQTITPSPGQNIAEFTGEQAYFLDIDVPETFEGLDFVVKPAIEIDDVGSALEGASVIVNSTSNLTGDVQWTVTGGSANFSGESTNQLTLKSLDSGIYTATATLRVGDDVFTASRTFHVEEVKAVLTVGDDQTTAEGLFSATRTLVNDPGSDEVTVLVDYGNGDTQTFSGTSARNFSLETVYGHAGDYVVNVSLFADDEVQTDSFTVVVKETSPTLDISIDEDFSAEGRSGSLEFSVFDPSRQINRVNWSYTVDWGDGSLIQDITDDIVVVLGRTGLAGLGHLYAEGTYQVTFRVIDNDGETFEVQRDVVVNNDVPQVELILPGSIIEDLSFSAAVVITDADATSTVWDFGDGSALQTTNTPTHTFGRDGNFTITVTVTDADGQIVTTSREVTVNPSNDLPVLPPIAPATITETFALTLPTFAIDQDGDALFYNLSSAPDGVTIDEFGVLHWTPTADQGPATYTFNVEVEDDGGGVTRPVTITVLDTGSISGELFVDSNGNGRRETSDAPLLSRVVMIDEGNDGSFEQTLMVDDEGRFQFANLPIGLYRVVADLGDDLGASTPQSFLINMTTPDDVTLTPMGVNVDIDGDGISNRNELNALAGPDANEDGVLDYLQSNVASIETVGGPVTFISSPGTTLGDIAAEDAIIHQTISREFPIGRLSFSVNGLSEGATATVEIRTPTDAAINLVYTLDDRINPLEPFFAEYGGESDETVELLSDRIRLTGDDGGDGDLDGSVNGERMFSLQPATVDLVWTNPVEFSDVSGDGRTTALDALLIINALRRNNGEFDLDGPRPRDAHYLDVSGDGRVSAHDALLVINQLRRQSSSEVRSGESESAQSLDLPIAPLAEIDKEKKDPRHGRQF